MGFVRSSALRSHRALIVILLLALALRLALWAQPLHEPANDEQEYVAVAYDLLEGRGWQFYEHYHWLRAPLYPLFLAGALWLVGGDLHLAALPNIALSVATVWIIYRLTRQLAAAHPAPQSRRHAPLLAALLAAVLLTLATFASLYMSETLFSFLFTAALLLLIRWSVSEEPETRNREPGTGNRELKTESGARGWLAALITRRSSLLLLAGACYGLATLTRSLPLAFLPVVVLWLVSVHIFKPGTGGQGQRSRQTIINALVFVLACVLTILPWTLRNCQAYGRCIPVETGLSYNLWAFNEPREDMSTIFRTLEHIANPAERADEATRRGLERLQEDPAILLRKLYPNWVYIWRVKPIQDRFLMANYYADPPPLLFMAAVVFDDALYVLILATSVVGVAQGGGRRWWRVSALLALWVLYVVASSMLTHGEARYRHFIFPVLIPYAALGMLEVGAFLRRYMVPGSLVPDGRRAALWLLRLVVIAVLLHTVGANYPWRWMQRGMGRSFYHLAGDIALTLGNVDVAEAAYQRAIRAQRTADIRIALGDLYRDEGRLLDAEVEYRAAWRKEKLYIAASARVGDILRRQDKHEQAREAFEGNHVAEQAVLDWSWRHLQTPAAQHIEVGEGLDFGYIGGMYPAEQVQGTWARWTDGRGLFRLIIPVEDDMPRLHPETPHPPVLVLRLAAPHPDTEGITARVCAAGRCQPVPLDTTWRTVKLLLPGVRPDNATSGSAERVVKLHSPTFAAPDGRRLGVLVDRATVYP